MGNRKAASRSIIHAVTKIYRAGEYAREKHEGNAGGKIR